MNLRRITATVVAAFVGVQIVIAAPSASLAANGPTWQVPLGPAVNNPSVSSTVYGGAEAMMCEPSAQPRSVNTSIGPNGVVAGQPVNNGCVAAASTRDGITVVPAYGGEGTPGGQYSYPIYAHKAAAHVWTSALYASDCDGSRLEATRLVVGNNGNIFGLAEERNYSTCTSGKQYLFGMRAQDGATLFVMPLPAAFTLHTGVNVVAYKQGLVVSATPNPTHIYYYSLTGALTRTTAITDVGEDPQILAVTPDGYVYTHGWDYTNIPAGCNAGGVAKIIKIYGPAGTTATYNPPACTWPAGPNSLRQNMPYGGSTWGAPILFQPPGINALVTLASISPTGSLLSQIVMPTGQVNGHYNEHPTRFWSDTRGNVVVGKTYQLQPGAYATTHWDVLAYDALTGAPKGSMTSRELPDTNRLNRMEDLAVANGRVFQLWSVCISEGTSPCTQWAMRLYGVDFSAIGMEDPRATLLAGISNTPTPIPTPKKRTVTVIGDSFAAARGVEPFIASSGRCKRSQNAWPLLVVRNTANNAKMGVNMACSDATSQDMLYGNTATRQPKQVSQLTKGADITLVSAGGNDVGFKSFVLACIVVDCTRYGEQMLRNINTLGNAGKLPKLYTEIRKRVGPQSEIYIANYGYQLPGDTGCATGSVFINAITSALVRLIALSGVGSLTTELRQFGISRGDILRNITGSSLNLSLSEVRTANQITQALNNKIAQVVAARNDSRMRVIDVNRTGSPFLEHPMCDPQEREPYFHGVIATDMGQSFHPNAAGNAAYAREFERLYRIVQP